MLFKSYLQSESIAHYVNEKVLHETDVQRRLRAETAKLPNGMMQISPDQGAFMSMIIRLINARRTLEIGAFTGYSALCVAMALPPDGKVVALDVSDEWTSIGRRYWREAGVADKIDLRLAPALESLDKMLKNNEAGTFDFAFIDADKDPYEQYYEACVKLIRPNGLIVMDNILGGGVKPASPAHYDPSTSKMHPLNMKIASDSRVEMMIAMVGGGFLLARKK